MGRKRGVASFLARGEEALKRGWFVVNALKRIAGAEDKRGQLEAEKRNFEGHKKARERRQAAAEMIDAMATVYGDLLGWYLGPNENHCAICKSANGKNFKASRPPSIGYPSTAHPNCACSPGAPWPNGQLLR